MILSILIPTTPDRETFFANLMTELCRQVRLLSEWKKEDYWKWVEILKDNRPQPITIGEKRNALLQQASGEWCAFIDSDDMISEDYLRILLSNIGTIRSHVNCFSLKGIMTTNGANPEVFEHSIKYREWKTNEYAEQTQVKYERMPNHLNCIRTSIAKQVKFPETNMGEDHEFSKKLQLNELITHEGEINDILYHYKYRTKK